MCVLNICKYLLFMPYICKCFKYSTFLKCAVAAFSSSAWISVAISHFKIKTLKCSTLYQYLKFTWSYVQRLKSSTFTGVLKHFVPVEHMKHFKHLKYLNIFKCSSVEPVQNDDFYFLAHTSFSRKPFKMLWSIDQRLETVFFSNY